MCVPITIEFGRMVELVEQYILTKVARVHLCPLGIVEINFTEPEAKVTLEDAKEVLEARLQMHTADEKQLLLVDIRNNPSSSREAKEFGRSEEVRNTTQALALITGNQLSRLLGNFYISFNKGNYPVKLFSNTNEATEWLLQQR